MKATAIFIVVALLITLHGCGDEPTTPAKPVALPKVWDTISVETSHNYHNCWVIWQNDPVIIRDDSTYTFQENYTKQKKSPYCDSASFPMVNFTTHDVIWWNYVYGRYQNPKGILRKNDSLQCYEYISLLTQRDIDPQEYSTRHFHIVPKLNPHYSITFHKDTLR